MDGHKQEAIDMLLLGNSYSGELGLRSKALLEKTELLGTGTGMCLFQFHSHSTMQVRFHSAGCCVTDGATSQRQRSCVLPWEHGM